jgi:hypothetical protein
LDKQPGGPKQEKPECKLSAQRGAGQFPGGAKTQNSHQQYDKGYEKGMDPHHLPVYQLQAAQLIFPVEVFRKKYMHDSERHQKTAHDSKMKLHFIQHFYSA